MNFKDKFNEHINNFKQVERKFKYPAMALLSAITLMGATEVATFAGQYIPVAAYEVVNNGDVVGVVSTEDMETDSQLKALVSDSVSEEIGKEVIIENDLELVPVSESKVNMTETDEVIETISEDAEYQVEMYAIYVDDEMVTKVESEEEAYNLLEEIKEPYITDDSTDASFVEDVDVVSIFDDEDEMNSKEEAIEILNSTDNPLLSVQTVDIDVYEAVAESPVEIVENPDEYITYSKVLEEGTDGTKEVTEEITKVNGVEVDSEILSEEILVEPTTTKIEEGTSTVLPKKAIGSFVYPSTSTGRISDTFNTRGGTHDGIDIALPYGTEVVASDGGVVTYAGWMSGYGNLVIIDHENGYETYYGHNSSICVSEGERVAQGQEIAHVGSTGRSSGNHIHFEVREDGIPKDPFNYIS